MGTSGAKRGIAGSGSLGGDAEGVTGLHEVREGERASSGICRRGREYCYQATQTTRTASNDLLHSTRWIKPLTHSPTFSGGRLSSPPTRQSPLRPTPPSLLPPGRHSKQSAPHSLAAPMSLALGNRNERPNHRTLRDQPGRYRASNARSRLW